MCKKDAPGLTDPLSWAQYVRKQFKKTSSLNPSSHKNKVICRREEHAIDDVNHAIGCVVVRRSDFGQRLQTWTKLHDSTPRNDVQRLALNCCHSLEALQICGEDVSRHNVISENVNQLSFVGRLHQVIKCASWKTSKGCVRWGEHGKWAWGTQSGDKITTNRCGDQRRKILVAFGQINNVLGSWSGSRS